MPCGCGLNSRGCSVRAEPVVIADHEAQPIELVFQSSEGFEVVGACPIELPSVDLNAVAVINSAVGVSHAHSSLHRDQAYAFFPDVSVFEDVSVSAPMDLAGVLVLSLRESCCRGSRKDDG